MKKPLVNIIATLFIFQLGAAFAQSANEEIAESQVSAESVPAAKTETEKTLAADKATDPITGAFGIPIGKRFDPSMVARVLDEQAHTYPSRNRNKRQGTLLSVEPHEPDARFQSYALKMTDNDIVYAIRGDYQFEVEMAQGKKVGIKRQRELRATCKKAVKALAEELEARHGKARGKGWDGEWYAFRQLSQDSDLSLRLYANRCRSGMYSIVYTDNKARQGGMPAK